MQTSNVIFEIISPIFSLKKGSVAAAVDENIFSLLHLSHKIVIEIMFCIITVEIAIKIML